MGKRKRRRGRRTPPLPACPTHANQVHAHCKRSAATPRFGCRLMSTALTGRGRGGGTSSAARPRDTQDASQRSCTLQQLLPAAVHTSTSGSAEHAAQRQQAEPVQLPHRQRDGADGLRHSKSSPLQANSFDTVISAAIGEAIPIAPAAAARPSSLRVPATRGRGGRRTASSRSALLDGRSPPPRSPVRGPRVCARCLTCNHRLQCHLHSNLALRRSRCISNVYIFGTVSCMDARARRPRPPG